MRGEVCTIATLAFSNKVHALEKIVGDQVQITEQENKFKMICIKNTIIFNMKFIFYGRIMLIGFILCTIVNMNSCLTY